MRHEGLFCLIDDCPKPAKTKHLQLCSMHDARYRRHGDPHTKLPHSKPRPFAVTFEMYVDSSDPYACWEWGGTTDRAGYGRTTVDRAQRFAHRAVYQYINDVQLRPEQILCHTCDNPPCVNPSHLFVGTHADNVRDCVDKGRTPRGEKHRSAKLNAEQVMEARRQYLSGIATVTQLAKQHGMHKRSMHSAIRGTTWKHLPQPDIEIGEAA